MGGGSRSPPSPLSFEADGHFCLSNQSDRYKSPDVKQKCASFKHFGRAQSFAGVANTLATVKVFETGTKCLRAAKLV